ncbi:hypothetical protein TRFO_38651 [Tritrichomonas foetus]|uniref:Peptidase C1A papain C-terminal domain-containing protein n=1 Tax=Tritrichomonas foetus TaxID=1144522 RepID=A0A1J4JBV0_9EUKA|nr:hypothetical protein TRFO_38651 [Tritrichomonas foetus]|eukprot:OHS95131.1 hypothetical protein TRFO_38651 [Tritrichomonas foetus]
MTLIIFIFHLFFWILAFRFGSEELANYINEFPNLTWRARSYNFPVRKEMPILLSDIHSSKQQMIPISKSLNKSSEYNFFIANSHCIQAIYNQKKCHKCYAFAAASVLSQRFCKVLHKNFHFDPYDLINNDYFSPGCSTGGHEHLMWKYIQYNGLTNKSCRNQTSKLIKCITSESKNDSTNNPLCNKDNSKNDMNKNENNKNENKNNKNENNKNVNHKNDNNKNENNGFQMKVLNANNNTLEEFDFEKCLKYYIKYRSAKTLIGEEAIQSEILENGPVTALFKMNDDFGNYESGIYKSIFDNDAPSQLHTVVIYGWGIENDVPFWLIQNSYGKDWGINGSFKMIRGINHLGIEEYATAALPLIEEKESKIS